MSEHTPGPWGVDSLQADDYRVNISSCESNVAAAYHLNDDPANPDEECLANAQLIAAAPELLEALKGLFEHCAMIHKHWGDGDNQKEADIAIQTAHAAIQKAEGTA